MATPQAEAVPPKRIPFQPLKSIRSEIRLLEIQPARDVINGGLVCRLVNVPLTEDLEFIGLSALVGDPTVTEDIRINHHRTPVPSNLGQALRHVRAVFLPATPASVPRSSNSSAETQDQAKNLIDPYETPVKTTPVQPSKPAPKWLVNLMRSVRSILPDSRQQARLFGPEPLRLWTDSICINSRDPHELSHRREIVATAYGSAKMVVGWLGLKDETSELVLETIHTIDAAMPRRFGSAEDRELHPEHYAPHYVWMKDMMHLWTLPPGLQRLEDWPTYKAMHAFMSRPYFQREWIVNEIALAKFPAFLLGDSILSWKQVLRMNRATEELVDHGADVFPEDFRKALNFFPLTTVYTLLGEFERRQAADGDDVASSAASTRSFPRSSTLSHSTSK
ncbi:Heterokaryon incompatibility protein 6, OR allele [Cytospora mali]|uniref:Heterokaryon incompatibility protein 6, OR allele n=1 Tax=Cytospora mali TaxID=578113 RepID=A0A194VV36_CYTMA|nr:Heterokaryon incompatibility protein 6, OR allele [Valsa mali]